MIVKYAPDATDRFTTNFVQQSARLLVAGGCFGEQDLEDLVQELTLAVVESIPNYNPDRAQWSTWVKTVVLNKSMSLIRASFAECRKIERTIGSLSALTSDEDGQPTELGLMVQEHESFMKIGVVESSRQTQEDLRVDVEAAIAQLPPKLRQVAEALRQWPLAEAVRETGIARSTFVARMKKVREHFERLGLRVYLQPAK